METMTRTDRARLSNEQPGLSPLGGLRMAPLDVQDGFWGLPRRADTVLQQVRANGRAPRPALSGRPATDGRR
jgi:hypothetical protein